MTSHSLLHILFRLNEAHRYRRRIFIGEKASAYCVLVGGMLLAYSLPGGFWEFSAAVRWVMLVSLITAVAAGGFFWVFLPLRKRWNHEQMARRVEEHYPEINNGLINSVQLGAQPGNGSSEFIDRIVAAADEATARHSFQDAFGTERLRRLSGIAGCLVLALGVYGGAAPKRLTDGLTQIFRPGALVPVNGLPDFGVKPGNATVFFGEDLAVRATITSAPNDIDLYDAQLLTEGPGQDPDGEGQPRSGPQDMLRSGSGTFVFVLRELKFPVTYRVKIGRRVSDAYRVAIAHRPKVTRIDAEYHFPRYCRLEPRKDEDSDGDVRAVKGSRVRLQIAIGPSGKKLQDAKVELSSGDIPVAVTVAPDRETLEAVLAVEKDDTYTIQLVDTDGISNTDPTVHHITAVRDVAPKVTIKHPAQAISVGVGETVPLRIEAGDDFGVADLFVLSRTNDAGAVRRLVGWREFANPRLARVTHNWFISPDEFRPGDTVSYHAEAMDTNPQPGTASTKEFVLRITDPAEKRAERQKALNDWERALHTVLKMQRAAKERAAELTGPGPLEDFGRGVGRVKQDQMEIHTRTKRIAGEMSESSVRTTQVRKTLNWLVANPMTEAIRLSDLAHAHSGPEKSVGELKSLLPVQDQIISALEKVLDVLPKLSDAPETPDPSDKGGDLPDDSMGEGLQKLAEDLKEFAEEQKKVVENSADLAKRPVDDLTQEEDAELRKLEAKEDRWSDFMQDAFTDLSKVPEQDFANPSMLKELIETQSEIEMAKDALAKKAAEIATPLEENGAELAEALTTHLERWLPETPDRDKWQMEEPLGDYETPMAELPKELEDIVGDLLEEEEDLFEEMEDTSSSWSDSLDKGAGWDAMDGPISNMSAQGVTGNRLPNTSEISGRSGEGRTGKASGEFVEEEATGKGGRRTPTRLTPDPFESGSVKDSAPEAGGGSTGGGKESGAGGEGLEGPAPDMHERQIKALAQRQAELRNRAEKIKLQLEVSNFPALFQETLKTMEAVEQDLRSGRYQDAFRRRAVLVKRLESTRQFLSDEVRVRRDTTNSLPVREQEMVMDAMNGPVPRGYEDALKSYYQAISK